MTTIYIENLNSFVTKAFHFPKSSLEFLDDVKEVCPHGEDWEIIDSDIDVGRYPSPEVFDHIGNHDHKAIKAFIDYFGVDELDKFEERYCGCYDSPEEYAQQYCEDAYGSEIDKLPDIIKWGIDYKRIAHELGMSDIHFADVSYDTCYVFYTY